MSLPCGCRPCGCMCEVHAPSRRESLCLVHAEGSTLSSAVALALLLGAIAVWSAILS